MSGGSTQGGTTYQQTSSSSEPPSFIQPMLKQALNNLSTYYAQNPTAPAYYPGQTVADLSAPTTSAINQAGSLATSNPVTGASTDSLTKFLNGDYTNPLTNPDFQSALTASHQPYIDQFNTQIIPGITSQFAGSGRSGGSGLQQQFTQQALTNLNTTLGNADAQAGSKYYTDALQQMLAANGLVPGINSSLWQNVSGQGAAGSTLDNYNQAIIDAAMAKYNYNVNAPFDYVSKYVNILNGGYPGGNTTSSGSGTTYTPTNQFGSILGSGLGLAGLGLQAYSAFSDRRLKEDIRKVGETDDGQKLYHYRYKGDPVPRIGLMAQEVAKKKPEAVERDPSGFLKVNYAKALGLF